MAFDKITHHQEHLSRGMVELEGIFDCNGSSDPASFTGSLSKVATVAHTSTGLYTITFNTNDKPGEIRSVQVSFAGDVTQGDQVFVGALSTANGTVTVRTKDGSGNTDIPSGEAVNIHVWVRISKYKNLVNN